MWAARLGAAAAALALAGCMPTILPEPQSLSAVGPDETVVVGRFEIRPPLAGAEQEFGLLYKKYRGEAYLQVGERPEGLPRARSTSSAARRTSSSPSATT